MCTIQNHQRSSTAEMTPHYFGAMKQKKLAPKSLTTAGLLATALSFVSYVAAGATALWIVTLCCDRLYALHVVYLDTLQQIKEEEWLRKNCQDPVFYSNLRSHTDLCNQVNQNAMRSVLLFSLNQVLATTHLCGTQTCLDYARGSLQWFSTLSLPFMIAIALGVVFCPVALVQTIRFVAMLFSTTTSRGHSVDGYSPFYGHYSGPGAVHYSIQHHPTANGVTSPSSQQNLLMYPTESPCSEREIAPAAIGVRYMEGNMHHCIARNTASQVQNHFISTGKLELPSPSSSKFE